MSCDSLEITTGVILGKRGRQQKESIYRVLASDPQTSKVNQCVANIAWMSYAGFSHRILFFLKKCSASLRNVEKCLDYLVSKIYINFNMFWLTKCSENVKKAGIRILVCVKR